MRSTSLFFSVALLLGCSTSKHDSGGGGGGVAGNADASVGSGGGAGAPETGTSPTGGAGGTASPQADGASGQAYGCSLAQPCQQYSAVSLRLYPTDMGLRTLAYSYRRWLVEDVWGSSSDWYWSSIGMDGVMGSSLSLRLDGGSDVIPGTPNLLLSPGLGELRVEQFDDHSIVSPARAVWTAPRGDAGRANYLMNFQVVRTPGVPTVFWTQALETGDNQVQFARLAPEGDLREPPRVVPLDAPVARLVQIAALPDGFAVLFTRFDTPTDLLYVSLDEQGQTRQAAVSVGDIAEPSVLGRSAPMLVLADQVVIASSRLTGSYEARDAARALDLVRLDFSGRRLGAPQILQAPVEDWEYSAAAWVTSGANVGFIWSGFEIDYSCRSCDPDHSLLRFALLDASLAVQGEVTEIEPKDGGRFQSVEAVWQGPSILLTATLDRYSDEYEENDYTIAQPLQCSLP